MAERLDKFLSQAAGMSRSHALTHIRSGRVLVDDVEVRDTAAKILPTQTVKLNGEILTPFSELLLMLHKPMNVVTSHREGASQTVMELIPPPLRHKDLAPIGRLDKDTTGLLLLTTDGALNHRLTHPKKHVDKVYLVTLEKALPENAAELLQNGLTLDDGPCLPALLEQVETFKVRLTLREGRFHQVKRMMLALGSRVVRLHRERVGGLALPADLLPGQVRTVTPSERELLFG